MTILDSFRSALPGADDQPSEEPSLAADSKASPPPSDLRCANPECDLFQLRLEADEVTPTPGAQPDRCASCGQPLHPFSG